MAGRPTRLVGTILAKTIGLRDIPVKDLVNDPANVRRRSGPIGELEDNIAHYGVLEPIVVRAKGSKFAVVIGSRRFSAARAAGLKTIPAIVKELTDEEAFVESAVENIQRETLDPADELAVVEKAHAIYDDVGDVARLFDKSTRWVEDHLKAQQIVSQDPKVSRGTSRFEGRRHPTRHHEDGEHRPSRRGRLQGAAIKA